MTTGQCDILRYVEMTFPGAKTEVIGDSVVRVTDSMGRRTDYCINLFGDILEKKSDGKNRIVAESDLPHNLDSLPLYARPTKWTRKTV